MQGYNVGKLGDLDLSLDCLWSALTQGAAGKDSAARLCTVSTVTEAGEPRARTMIMRGVDRKTPSVMFYTDRRSDKVREVQKNPLVSICYYSFQQKFQVRLAGEADLHVENTLSEKAWEMVPESEYGDYAGQDAPGAVTGRPIHQLGSDPRKNFSVIRVQIREAEWLQIGPGGNHRRARFHWNAPGVLARKEWIAP